MNILIVSELFYPKLRGGEIVLWRLAKGLANNGHRVRVLTSRLDETPAKEEESGVEIYRPFKVDEEGKSRSFGAVAKKALFMKDIYSHLTRLIREAGPDVIYNNAYTATLPAGLAGRKFDLPVVTNIGNLQGSEHFEGGTNPLVAGMQIVKENFILRFGGHQGIRVASKEVAKKIEGRCRAKVFPIPSPIDDFSAREVRKNLAPENLREELNVGEEEYFLLYVGALEGVKNLDSLLKVLTEVSRPFKLVLVGEGREEVNLKKSAEDLGIRNRVSFLGRKENRYVLKLMASADALLLSSRSENLPTVVLEALSLNTPVIATDVGGISEIDSKNLTLVDSVEGIGRVLENGVTAHEDDTVLEEYSQKSIVEEFEDMFKEVVESVS